MQNNNTVILKCEKCGYTKTYFANEITKDETCELCNGRMKVTKEELKNIVLDDSIANMERNIKYYGHAKTWEIIESFQNYKTRLAYRNLFLKAGGIIPKSEI